MKALVLEGIKKLALKEVPDPTIDDNGILIRVKANGVCRTDWHSWTGDLPTINPIIGHEMAGIVEEVGKNIRNFKRGDRVIVPFSGSEGTCRHCMEGNTHLCESNIAPGVAYSGGFGEYVAIPFGDRNLINIPDEVTYLDGAALGCRFMTAYHGVVDQVKVQPGDWVAVYGCGGIGLSAINIVTSLGAVAIGIDINEDNLELARAMGAVHTINSGKVDPVEAVKEITRGGADVSIDALGITQTCISGIHSLRKAGRHLQIGLTSKKEAGHIAIPVDHMILNEIQFLTTYGMPAHRFKSMIPQIAQGRLTPGKMVTGEVSLSDVHSIFEGMSNFTTKGTYVVTKYE